MEGFRYQCPKVLTLWDYQKCSQGLFNIFFCDAGALFYIAPLVQKIFKVWQTPNQLLKAVSADLSVYEHVAGCKALASYSVQTS